VSRKTQFIKHDQFVPAHWQPFVDKKVTIKFKVGKRSRLKQGRLQITDTPFGCDCCRWTVAVLVTSEGVIKWSSSPSIRSVGSQW
jgi:hypothetical protein